MASSFYIDFIFINIKIFVSYRFENDVFYNKQYVWIFSNFIWIDFKKYNEIMEFF